MLFENTNPPNHGILMHVHELEDESFYVLDGEVEMDSDGEKVRVRAGGIVLH